MRENVLSVIPADLRTANCELHIEDGLSERVRYMHDNNSSMHNITYNMPPTGKDIDDRCPPNRDAVEGGAQCVPKSPSSFEPRAPCEPG
jgi:hypothetical protein